MRQFRMGASALFLTLALWSAPALAQQAVVLWPDGAPNARPNAGPEVVTLASGGRERIVTNVHAPSLTVYLPPAAKATGAAVIIMPGGGHRQLSFDHEGVFLAQFLSERGVAAFVLKYRLATETGSTYTIDGDEMADARRAIRLVRSRAANWGVRPDAVGVIGFSAGAQLAAKMGAVSDSGAATAADIVERQSSRPDFMGIIYGTPPEQMNLSANTPPAFLLVGDGDRAEVIDATTKLSSDMRKAGASAELHILSGIAHGFGMRPSHTGNVAAWPTLFYNWLGTKGFLAKKP